MGLVSAEPKRVVKYLAAAICPPALQETVRAHFDQEAFKHLTKGVVAFLKWLKRMTQSYMIFEPGKSHEGSGKDRNPPSRDTRPPASRLTDSTQTDRPRTTSISGRSFSSRSEFKCLKCGSNKHLVKDCPRCRPGEAKTLLEQRRSSRAPSKNAEEAPKVAPGVTGTMKAITENPTLNTGMCAVVVEGEVQIDATLLDSGADTCLVSGATLQALQKKGVFVSVLQTGLKHELLPLGGGKVIVSRMVRLDRVEFATSASPLVLRKLKCWVHEEDETLTLTLSRGVMESLGYSTEALLARAAEEQAERNKDAEARLTRPHLHSLVACVYCRPNSCLWIKLMMPHWWMTRMSERLSLIWRRTRQKMYKPSWTEKSLKQLKQACRWQAKPAYEPSWPNI